MMISSTSGLPQLTADEVTAESCSRLGSELHHRQPKALRLKWHIAFTYEPAM